VDICEEKGWVVIGALLVFRVLSITSRCQPFSTTSVGALEATVATFAAPVGRDSSGVPLPAARLRGGLL